MKPTRYGPQPVRPMLMSKMTIRGVAAEIGCSPAHLRNALVGRTRPSAGVLKALCQMFKAAPEDLFTADVLSKMYVVVARKRVSA